MKVDKETLSKLARNLRAYLDGMITHFDINLWVLNNMNATEEKIEAGDKSELLNHIFWAVRLLEEPEQFRTKDEELVYLLDCLEGRKQFTKEAVDSIYTKNEQYNRRKARP